MKTWTAPVLETLNIAMTESGFYPATYESYAGTIDIDGVIYAVISGHVGSSGEVLFKPYICHEDNTYTYYDGPLGDISDALR